MLPAVALSVVLSLTPSIHASAKAQSDPMSGSAATAQAAISAFTTWCFKAGQTQQVALANMRTSHGGPLPFAVEFWDKSLAPAPDTPAHAERRCEISFDGDHRDAAMTEVSAKMAKPPVFGTPIALPAPYVASTGTAYIEARELLRKRVAVVHIGMRDGQTFIGVDRLPAGSGLPRD